MNQGDTTIFDKKAAWKKLTHKQKVFTRYILDHPNEPEKNAAKEAYQVLNDNVASVISSENLRKPNILAVLAGYDQMAQETIAEMMEQRDDKRLAFDASKDILDRIHGKAKQTTEVKNNTTVITLDLTGGALGQPPQHILNALEG